jgi:non-ribosomal peptide synthetase component F
MAKLPQYLYVNPRSGGTRPLCLWAIESSRGQLPGWGLRKRAKMTNSPWLAHYPSEVPQQLPPVPFANLPELFGLLLVQYEKTTAFTQVMPNGMNGSLTYAQVDQMSDHFASYLREELGLAVGDRVAVQMPNCLSYPIVAFGIFKADVFW